jgi:hypothetical protein
LTNVQIIEFAYHYSRWELIMNIAIIYHTLSGQTRKLAGLMEAGLAEKRHSVKKTELRTSVPVTGGTTRQPMNFEVINLPDLAEVDVVCIGGPVWAFGPSTVAYKAILQMPSLKGKLVLPFVTMGFPCKCMGGKNAIRTMSRELTEKGAQVLPGIIVPKMFHDVDLLSKQAALRCVELLNR